MLKSVWTLPGLAEFYTLTLKVRSLAKYITRMATSVRSEA